MKTKEIINKLIQYYESPDHPPGYDVKDGKCLYYKDEQTKCAIGCLVSNPSYLQEFSEKVIADLDDSDIRSLYHYAQENEDIEALNMIESLFPEDLLLEKENKIDFLEKIQSIHDRQAGKDKEEFNLELKTRLNKLVDNYLTKGELIA